MTRAVAPPRFEIRDGVPQLVFIDADQIERALVLDIARDPRYFRKLRGKNELLAKAVGLKGHLAPRVWDLSLGLAEDAWTLARLGCVVQGFERETLLHQLVQASLEKLKVDLADPNLRGGIEMQGAQQRITVAQAQAIDVIKELRNSGTFQGLPRPQVLYFDPMYSGTAKSSALPRLEMQLLRGWLGEDSDQAEILRQALQVPGLRVVVKRPARTPALALPVTHAFEGEKVRYDMYQNTNSANEGSHA